MLSTSNRAIAAATAAAIALTSLSFTPAVAAPKGKQPVVASESTDFSARRRGSGNRAAAAAIIGVFGTIAGIAAAEAARDRYQRHHYHHNPYGYGAYGGGYYCGYGPAGPIPPGGYWHYGRFYAC